MTIRSPKLGPEATPEASCTVCHRPFPYHGGLFVCPSCLPVTAQEAIAETWVAHQPIHHGTWSNCTCGAPIAEMDTNPEGYVAPHADHVAAAVVEAVRALPAEQRRELCGESHFGPWAPEEDFSEAYDLTDPPPTVQGQAHTERSETL